MKRFEIKTEAASIFEDLNLTALQQVKELQEKNVSPIYLIDHEKKTNTVYRKGTHDKNYFIRQKQLPTLAEANNDSEAFGNGGDNENPMPEVQEVAKPRKSRSVTNKKKENELQ